MSVARVTELSCTSSESFEDAIRQGIERAQRTLRGVRGAWVKEQRVNIILDLIDPQAAPFFRPLARATATTSLLGPGERYRAIPGYPRGTPDETLPKPGYPKGTLVYAL